MANHVARYFGATGGIYYAHPAPVSAGSVLYSLADWTTNRVVMPELIAPNLGAYQATLDDAKGSLWLVFAGASQPASWDLAIATIDLSTTKASLRAALGGRWTIADGQAADISITDAS